MANIQYNFDDNNSSYRRKKSHGKVLRVILLLILLLLIAGGGFYLYWNRPPAKPVTPPVVPAQPISPPPAAVNTKLPDPPAPPSPAVSQTAPESAPVVPNPELEQDLTAVKQLIAETDYQKAKTLVLEMLKKYGDAERSSSAYRKLGKLLSSLNMKILFSGIPGDKTVRYIVRSGDSLSNIAIRHNLPVTAIQKANKISGVTIHPGQTLAIYQGDWRIEVNKDARLLYVFDGDNLFSLYDIGIGKEGRTPVGDFMLVDKIENPDWYSPDGRIIPFGDKENLLGTRWLKLMPSGDTDPYQIGYGIHGTWDEGSITQSLSNGCIRMTNETVEELFTYIPRQTKVKIY